MLTRHGTAAAASVGEERLARAPLVTRCIVKKCTRRGSVIFRLHVTSRPEVFAEREGHTLQ